MKVAIFFVAIANFLAVLSSSVFAVRGDGGEQTGVVLVILFGGFWVVSTTVFALRVCSKGGGFLGLAIAGATIPFAYGTVMFLAPLLELGEKLFDKYQSKPIAVEEACKTAGEKIFSLPSKPMNSFVYEWTTKDERARPGRIKAGKHVDVVWLLDNHSFPPAIAFVERMNNRRYPASVDDKLPYLRKANGGTYLNVEKSTADVLIQYEISQIETPGTRRVFELFEITAKERVNGKLLATFKFITRNSMTESLVCGGTAPDEIDVGRFILKTMGLPSK